MYFSLNDGLEARAAAVLRADGALLVGSETEGLLVGETSSQQILDFAEASEELYRFVLKHAADSALLAYRSQLRGMSQDDMKTAAVWPPGRWPRIKLHP